MYGKDDKEAINNDKVYDDMEAVHDEGTGLDEDDHFRRPSAQDRADGSPDS